jgi:hypothetical protein
MSRIINTPQNQVTARAMPDASGEYVAKGLYEVSNVFQELKQQKMKNDLLKSNNLLAECAAEYQNEFLSYTEEISKNGLSDQAKNRYKTNINDIKNRYASEIPLEMRSVTTEKLTSLGNIQNIKLKAVEVQIDERNQLETLQNSVNTYMDQAKTYGRNQDFELALENITTQLQPLKANAEIILGKKKADKFIQNVESGYLVSALSGSMQTNPQNTLNLMDHNPIVRKILGDDKFEKMRNGAVNRLKVLNQWESYKSEVGSVVNDVKMLEDLLAGRVSFAEMEDYIQHNNLNSGAADYLRKQAGYKTMEDFEKSLNSKKLSAEDKITKKEEIEEELLKVRIDKDADVKILASLRDKIFEYANNGYFTNSETEDYLNELKITSANVLASESKKQFTDSNFIGWDVGGEQIKKHIDNILKNYLGTEGIAEDKKLSSLSSNHKKNIAEIKLLYYETYRENITKAAQEKANELRGNLLLPDGKPTETSVIVNSLSSNERRKLFKEAVDKTLKDVASYRYNVATENKTNDEINKAVDLKILFENKEEISRSIEDLIWERKRKNPFYLDIKMSVKPEE